MAKPTIVTRVSKGSALTWTEGDANFTNLQTAAVPDGGAAGEYLVKNSATNWDFGWTDRVNAKTIYETVKNVSGGSLTKGTPVYQVGMAGNTVTVAAARADDPAKLSIGVLDATIADEAEGIMLILGEIKGVNTASFAIGDPVYLGATGGFTNVAPTATDVAVQFLGVVFRVDATVGSGYITGTLTEDMVRYTGTAFEFWNGTGWVSGGGSGIDAVVDDTTPQLGGDLDVNGNDITAALDADVNIVVTGTGAINLSHGDPDEGNFVRVGNGVNDGVIQSAGDTELFLGGAIVNLFTDKVAVGTGDAASTITSNGAYNLVLGTNTAVSGASPLITLNQNSGITLQATASTNFVSVINSVFQHSMNSSTAASGASFVQAHTTADANNFTLGRARGSTLSPAAVQAGDELAEFVVSGHDGQTGPAGYEQAWGFTTTVIDTPTSNVMPTITEFVINTAANTRSVYHSIEPDLVFRVKELGLISGETDLNITADAGSITLAHGDPDEGELIRVGNGTDYAAIASNGAQDLTFGADLENIAGPVTLTLGSDGNIFLTPRAGGTVDIESSVTRLGSSEAAATLTSNGAYNLVIGTNAATVGTSPTITLEQNSGIVLQATANTNSVRVLNSTFQHFMNNNTTGSQAFFLQAHETADANNFSLGRARGTTLSPSAVQIGDELAEFFVSGHDGQTGFAGYEPSWGFTTTVIDTPTSNVMPVRTDFVINTDANTLTTYHSISAEDGVFRVIELGTVSGVTDLTISAGEDGNVIIAPDGTGKSVVNSINYNEGAIYDLGTTGGTIAPDVANGNSQKITLNSALTINAFTNPIAGQSLTLIVYGDTAYTSITSTMKFAGGDKTLTATAGCIDIVTIYFDGTTYFASIGKGFV